MTSAESFDSNAIEVDGILFETLMSERVLKIPTEPPEPDGYTRTPVRLGIRITNNTQNTFRFNFYTKLNPEMLGIDGQFVPAVFLRIRRTKARETHFPLVMPFKSVTFLPPVNLVWSHKDNHLKLNVRKGSGGCWTFDILNIGTYQFRFKYENQNATQYTFDIYDDRHNNITIVENFWIGTAFTPFVEFKRLY